MKKLCSKLVVCFSFLATSLIAQNAMQVHIIDVGQGSAALIEFPCGVIMIDTGGESNAEFDGIQTLTEYLENFFARRSDLHNTINLMVISHPHKDHTLGVKSILAKYSVKNVITNGQITGSGRAGQMALHQLVADRENTPETNDDIGYFEALVSNVKNGGTTNEVIDPISCSGVDPIVKILWGQSTVNPGWTNADFTDQNNHSVVCRIDYGQSSVLFTGDLEIPAIKSLMSKHSDVTIFDADVYIAGHHGSKNGSTSSFIKAISPEIAILSFGDPNRQLSWTAYAYGHPNKGIVKMLSDNVSRTRVPKNVMVGDGAENFEYQVINKALYGVGWDGAILLSGTSTGTWTYVEPKGLINLNLASIEELKSLPAISDLRANAIISYRQTHAFTSVDQLDDVPGIGPATVAALRPFVKI